MDRQILNFTANEQALTVDEPIKISTNKVNYIEAHFTLGTNWSGYDSIRAIWFNDFQTISTVLDSLGNCVVPFEVMKRKGNVKVNLVGSISEDDVLTDRLTSYPVVAVIVDCTAQITGANTSPITPSEFEQFAAAVHEDAERAEQGASASEQSATESANSAQNSAESAQEAEAHASSAQIYAGMASNEAEASANSASEAQTYAQNASESATNAEGYAEDAESARDTILGMRATATTLPAGSDATASYSEGVMSFGIPRGDKGERGQQGEQGETGATPNLSIGTVTTLDPDESATATISGTAENPILSFGIPKGEQGDVSQAELDEAVTDLKSAISERTDGMNAAVDAKTGRVLFFNDCEADTNFFTTSGDALEVTGSNLLDPSTRIDNRIKNDSGNEVYDGGSSYFSRLIPVKAGLTLQPNFLVQRYYLYDSSKAFLRRTTNSNYRTYPYTVESDVCYVQVQIIAATTGDLMLNFGDSSETYEAFKSNTDGNAYDGQCIVNSSSSETVTLHSWVREVSSSLDTPEYPELSIPTVKAVTDTLGGIVGSATFTAEGAIVTLQSELMPRIKALTTDDAVTYYGQNIFDSSTRVSGKIKNDSGVEIADSNSNYYSRYIPVSDKTIKANFDIQRIYLYDSSKGFISRTSAYAKRSQISFASNVKFVQIQVEVSKITDSMCIVYGNGDTTYKAFWESVVLTPHPNEDINIVGDGVTSISVDVEALGVKAVIPAVKAYPMWEPTTVTSDYSCTPLGQSSQSIPALTDTLGYLGFLETYFDTYLGEYADGYSVTREDLGLDSGAEATGNIASPIYSYTFAPKHYNKTVLLSAGMNTCEASTFFGVAYFIKALMEHDDDGMAALYNSTRFIVMPVICPSGIAHDPLLYPNSNNVRINKNFEYYGSWERLKNDRGGAYPDSEVETKALKYWLNKYAGSAFWLDCHSDTGNGSIIKHLGTIFCSDSATASRLNASRQEVINFYIDKGYITASDNVILGFSAQLKATAIYPKTVYGLEVTRIPSAMMEQFEYSTAWGSNGNTNNDQYAIKHYVAMIRYMVLIMCRDDQKIIFD